MKNKLETELRNSIFRYEVLSNNLAQLAIEPNVLFCPGITETLYMYLSVKTRQICINPLFRKILYRDFPEKWIDLGTIQ